MKRFLFVLIALTMPVSAKPTIKERAIEAVRPVAERDGFVLKSATCWQYEKTPSYVCQLCYVHPRERWGGEAVVWCDAKRCEWGMGVDDPRRKGVDTDRCFR